MNDVLSHLAQAPPTARRVALTALIEVRQHEAFLPEIVDRHLGADRLAPADRRLVTQLTHGVLRRRGTLDALLRPLIARPPDQVEPWLRDILRLGAFQLALLTHIPPHAALHETVELAATCGRPRGKGFVNAILRKLVSLLTDERCAGPSANALPLEEGHYRRLARPVLPEPAALPVEYLAAGWALPHWLASRWLERFGWEECVRLGFWCAAPGPLWLRCNSLRTDRATFLAALAAAGVAAEPGEEPQAIRLTGHRAIRDIPGYEQGWFTVQDESAQRVAATLAPTPGSVVLDLCAAPGGKTTHLAELMHNEGRIVACDVEEQRLQTLNALCQRLGISIVQPHRLDRSGDGELPAGPFDAVLVDVPCSNTGVLGRRPEVRWRLQPGDLRHLAALQTKLLLRAGERVRPGGTVVYSTCSIEPEENGAVVRGVLQQRRNLRLEAEQELAAGRPADGGYWARLRRVHADP